MINLRNIFFNNYTKLFIFLFFIAILCVLLQVYFNNKRTIEQMKEINISKYIEKPKEKNHIELFNIAQIFHYGKFSQQISFIKAKNNYIESANKSRDKQHKGKCYLALATLYGEQKIVDAHTMIKYYLSALECGYEESIIHIGRVYMNGIHPHYLPNKVLAGKIFSTFNTFSEKINKWCKVYMNDIMQLSYSDIDAIPIRDLQYKEFPNDIVQRINHAISKIDVVYPYKEIVDEKLLSRNHKDDTEVDADIILNKIPKKQTIANDQQNVHNTTLQNTANNIIDVIQNKNNNQFDINVQELLSKISCNKKKQQIQQVCSSLTLLNHSRYEQSEQAIFNMVWNHIKDNNDLIEIFIDNIISSIENDVIVCSTGKIMRMLSTLDIVDNKTPDLKPDWIIKEELANIVSNTITKTLNQHSSKYTIAYNSLDPTPEQQEQTDYITNIMKNTIIQKCKKDYVDTNILSQDLLDIYLQDYIDNI
jgi:hypothetical protein